MAQQSTTDKRLSKAARRRRRQRAKRKRANLLSVSAQSEPGTQKPVVSSCFTEPMADVSTGEPFTYDIDARAGKEITVKVRGPIGDTSELIDNLEATAKTADSIHLRINSGGGSVFQTIALYNVLRGLGKRITATVDGVAASAASLLLMAGDERAMADNAFVMVHSARGGVYGTATDLQSYIDLLERVDAAMVRIYAGRSGQSETAIRELLARDSWLDATESKEAGFVDTITGTSNERPAVRPKSQVSNREPIDTLDLQTVQRQVETLELSLSGASDMTIAAETDTPPPDSNADPKAGRIEAYRRQAAVDQCLSPYPKLAAQALEEDWDEGRIKAEANVANIRGSRARGPIVTGGGAPHVDNGQLLEATLLMKSGLGTVAEKEFKPPVLEGAHKMRGRSCLELARWSLEANGIEAPSDRNDLIRMALCDGRFQPPRADGTTMHNLSTALGNTLRRALIAAYQEAPRSWAGFAAIKDADDFRLHTSIRPSFISSLTELGAGGEIEHGDLAESTISHKLKTYASMATISREDVVNDNLNIFNELAPAMGIAWSRTVNDVAWEAVMDSSTHFTSARGNLLEGAGSALSATSLENAIKAIRLQRDGENNDLDLQPAVLAVCPELEVTARALLESIEVNRTGDNSPTGNALRNSLSLAVESRLSNTSKFSTASTTAWFVFCGPITVPVIVSFLGGQQAPNVEFFDLSATPNRLEVSWRVYGDVGGHLGDYRAGCKADGA